MIVVAVEVVIFVQAEVSPTLITPMRNYCAYACRLCMTVCMYTCMYILCMYVSEHVYKYNNIINYSDT